MSLSEGAGVAAALLLAVLFVASLGAWKASALPEIMSVAARAELAINNLNTLFIVFLRYVSRFFSSVPHRASEPRRRLPDSVPSHVGDSSAEDRFPVPTHFTPK